MLDIKLIREKPDFVRERLATRGRGDENSLAGLIANDKKLRSLIEQVGNLRAELNAYSKKVGQLKSKGEDASTYLARTKQVGEEIAQREVQLPSLEEAIQGVRLVLPNLPHESVPIGTTAADNPEVRRWGEAPKFAFPVKAHWDIGEQLGILDFARAAKISGSGFILYTSWGARLERALINCCSICTRASTGSRKCRRRFWSTAMR